MLNTRTAVLFLCSVLLLCHAQGTNPESGNIVDWRGLANDRIPKLAKLTDKTVVKMFENFKL